MPLFINYASYSPSGDRQTTRVHPRCLLLVGLSVVCFTTDALAPNAGVAWGQPAALRKNQQLFQDQHQKLRDRFLADLEKFKNRCRDEAAADEADEIERLIELSREPEVGLESLPDDIQPPLPGELPPDELARRKELKRLRTTYAAALYVHARKALKGKHLSLAYDLIHEAAFHDPDHVSVRDMLGYVRHQNRWVTPVAQAMLKQKKVWHPSFGWIPKAHVERYENGERYCKGSWMTQVKEAGIRSDFNNAWEIRTDHYLIKTNHSLERGVEIGLALEEFYRYFMQTFTGFFNSPDQINALFQGGLTPGRKSTQFRPYEVHYFRTEDEYDQRLKAKIPQIEMTNGLYYTSDRVAYFFDDPNANGLATLFHEASHQLFYESKSKDRSIAESAHFWIIEGIACYFESFQIDNGRVRIGDPQFERFRAARIRLLRDNYYVPLEQFAGMGMQAFQTDTTNIQKNYSQASGLAEFFMNYNQGEYRDALIAHLSQLYEGKNTGKEVKTLADLTGVDYEVLDQQYKIYLQEIETALNAKPPAVIPR
ncbi:MAG: DUF1570 domain-containing protein [Planctomycetaceae bacterium]